MRISIFLLIVVFAFNSFAQILKSDLVFKVNEPSKKTDKAAPLLIMLHGYGSNEEDLFNIAKTIDPRFMTISIRGPVVLQNGGYCFYNLEFLPNQKFKYDYNQAKESRIKILSFISKACRAYKLDSNLVFVMGFSQGAIMGYDLALAAPKKIKGVLALSGRLMHESKNLKTNGSQQTNTTYFIAHGNSDNVIKSADADSAVKFLKSKNVKEIIFNKYEMPHAICDKELNDIKVWLKKSID